MKKTIKIIDLLNKIANGEEVPKTVKYGKKIYRYVFKNTITGEYDYQGSDDYLLEYMSQQLYLSNVLNEEVEIIEDVKIIEDEEDKKIEKIKSLNNVGNCQNLVEFGDKQQLNNHILKDKINEIIEAINELKKGE